MIACLLIHRVSSSGSFDKVVVIINNVRENTQIHTLILDAGRVNFSDLVKELQNHLSETIKLTTETILQVSVIADYCISSDTTNV